MLIKKCELNITFNLVLAPFDFLGLREPSFFLRENYEVSFVPGQMDKKNVSHSGGGVLRDINMAKFRFF